ncbi:MAG TPA: hypothetical protein VHY20_08315 [Pirellulales bacterium]|jgi:hypothetical protein|nr:hypothetical protein [Pirellulales bacterium]
MSSTHLMPLARIAHARSGDKGNHANIGVIAYTPEGYEYLARELTPYRVAQHFAGLAPRRVVRYELPNLWALNFVLYDALAGGASRSLRIDTQGKLLATAIGELLLPEPPKLAAMVRPAIAAMF